jgi:hypothetical protein
MVMAHRRRWLRLDCDQSNQALRSYYERLGFAHVRDVEGLPRTTRPGIRAASLYQCAHEISQCPDLLGRTSANYGQTITVASP